MPQEELLAEIITWSRIPYFRLSLPKAKYYTLLRVKSFGKTFCHHGALRCICLGWWDKRGHFSGKIHTSPNVQAPRCIMLTSPFLENTAGDFIRQHSLGFFTVYLKWRANLKRGCKCSKNRRYLSVYKLFADDNRKTMELAILLYLGILTKVHCDFSGFQIYISVHLCLYLYLYPS